MVTAYQENDLTKTLALKWWSTQFKTSAHRLGYVFVPPQLIVLGSPLLTSGDGFHNLKLRLGFGG